MNLIQLSSLEKVFLQGKFDKKEFNGTTALKGEKISYQIAFKYEDDNSHYKSLKINVNSDLKDYIKLYYWSKKRYIPGFLVLSTMPLNDIDKLIKDIISLVQEYRYKIK